MLTTSRLGRILPGLLMALLLLLFLLAIAAGPDFFRYVEWARAFREGDPRVFLEIGHTLSPLGVPLTQWSHGPGLIFSIGSPLLQQVMSPDRQAIWMSWALTVLFWWAMFGLLRFAAGGDLRWALYGILVAILGTHLGFYSRSVGSETLSQTFIAVTVYWVLSRKEWRFLDTLLVGCLTGLLIINRAQVAVYALPPLVLLAYDLWRSRATRSRPRTALLLLAPLVPIFAAVLQDAAVNRWMTGSFLRSVYTFGNAAFSSLDFRRPELLAVLIHPWHGLLAYHPLYLLAFIALVALLLQSRSRGARLFYAGWGLVILTNVWLQASWYAWWLGTNTFGMRGLGAAAVILVPALIRFMSARELRGKSNAVLAVLVLAACAWSAPLFMASLYDETQSNLMTYAELLRFWVGQARGLRLSVLLAILTLGVAVLGSLVRNRVSGSSPHRIVAQVKARPALTVSLGLLFPTTVYALTRFSLDRRADEWGSPGALIPYLALLSVPLAVLVIMTFVTTAPGLNRPAQTFGDLVLSGAGTIAGCSRRAESALGWALVVLFIAANVIFARFAARMVREFRASSLPLHEIQYVGPAHVDEVASSYQEYLNVPGFSEKKEALLSYVSELQASSTAGAEVEIMRRMQGLPQLRLAADATVGEEVALKAVDLFGGSGEYGTAFHAGDLAGLSTHWEVLKHGRPLNFILRLQDAAGRVRLAVDYSPRLGGGTAVDHRGISLPPDLPSGQYEFFLIAYDRETGAGVPAGDAPGVSLATITVQPASQPPDLVRLLIPSPRHATIGDEIELLGYGVTPNPLGAESQGALHVWWRAVRKPGQPYRVRIELLDREGQPVAVSTRPLGLAPADTWQEGQVVSENYPLALDRGVLSGPLRLRLSLIGADGSPASPAVEAGEVAVKARSRTYRLPPMNEPTNVSFGNEIALRGYTVERSGPGGPDVRLTLYWQALEPVTADYKIFVHAVDDSGQVVAQGDSFPAFGAAPTRTWLPGEVIADDHVLTLRPGAHYRFLVGLYDPNTMQRLPTVTAEGHAAPEGAAVLGLDPVP